MEMTDRYPEKKRITEMNNSTSTPGLQQFASVLNDAFNQLENYASKPNTKLEYMEPRERFLKSLTSAYERLHSELSSLKDMYLKEIWLMADQQVRKLMNDSNLDGIHIRIRLGQGKNFGLIELGHEL